MVGVEEVTVVVVVGVGGQIYQSDRKMLPQHNLFIELLGPEEGRQAETSTLIVKSLNF